MAVVEFCSPQGFKAGQTSSAALSNRWRRVDPACLDLTDLPQPCSSPPTHPHAHAFIQRSLSTRLKSKGHKILEFKVNTCFDNKIIGWASQAEVKLPNFQSRITEFNHLFPVFGLDSKKPPLKCHFITVSINSSDLLSPSQADKRLHVHHRWRRTGICSSMRASGLFGPS